MIIIKTAYLKLIVGPEVPELDPPSGQVIQHLTFLSLITEQNKYMLTSISRGA